VHGDLDSQMSSERRHFRTSEVGKWRSCLVGIFVGLGAGEELFGFFFEERTQFGVVAVEFDHS